MSRGMAMARCAGVLSIALISIGIQCVFAQVAGSAAADAAAPYRSDPKFVSAMSEARQMVRQKENNFAADAFKKANKIAGGSCVECMQGQYDAQMALGNYKDAIAVTVSLQAATSSAEAKSKAAQERGQAMLAQGGAKPKPAQLEAAHAAFQEAIALSWQNATAIYRDGTTLARLGRMQEASAAPAFEVTALDGSRFNLDAMGGRVVLIDFWATWCGPCNEELPHMKKIVKEFAGQPLVVISVSWDSDEAKWKQFIQKNEMTWVQYRDADHHLSEQFAINAIPHYFTIDSDGVLTAEMLGEGSDVEGKLKKLVAKARDAKALQDHVAMEKPVTGD